MEEFSLIDIRLGCETKSVSIAVTILTKNNLKLQNKAVLE